MTNRAFRISFDEKVSKFVIEIQGFLGLSWHPAKVETSLLADNFSMVTAPKTRYFENYKEARNAVTEMGLDQIYDDFTKSKPWQQPEVQQVRQQYVGHQPLPQGM